MCVSLTTLMKTFFGPLALTTEMPSFSQKIMSDLMSLTSNQQNSSICLPLPTTALTINSIFSLLSEFSGDCECRTELPTEPREGKKLCEQFPCLCSLALREHTAPENEGA